MEYNMGVRSLKMEVGMKRYSGLVIGFAVALILISCNLFKSEQPVEIKELAVSPPSESGAVPDLQGTYSVTGTNPGGAGSYTGVATLVREGSQYKIHWEVGNIYDGIGKLEGKVLEVDWGEAGNPKGKVTYTLGPNGVLQGTWYVFEDPNKLGTETLTPKRF